MSRELSRVTQKYLTCFDGILRRLIASLGALPPGRSLGRVLINQLLPVHRAAGEMCRNLLEYTTCLPLQCKGEEMEAFSGGSMETLTALLQGGQCPLTPEAPLMRYLRRSRQVLDTMVYRMGSAHTTNDINANFMRQMIPLQQGLEALCAAALSVGLAESVKGEGEKQREQAQAMATALLTLLSVAEGH